MRMKECINKTNTWSDLLNKVNKASIMRIKYYLHTNKSRTNNKNTSMSSINQEKIGIFSILKRFNNLKKYMDSRQSNSKLRHFQWDTDQDQQVDLNLDQEEVPISFTKTLNSKGNHKSVHRFQECRVLAVKKCFILMDQWEKVVDSFIELPWFWDICCIDLSLYIISGWIDLMEVEFVNII